MTADIPGTSIRWAAGPLRFELASADPTVRRFATAVFAPWAARDTIAAGLSWQVDRVNVVPPAWRVWSSRGAETVASSAERAVTAVEYAAVGAIVESPVPIAHGALVAWGGRGILLVGRGEAGKSTLACALWERGAALLSDDVALLDPASAVAAPAPRRVSVRETSRALLGDGFFTKVLRGPSSVSRRDGCLFHPVEIAPRPRPGPVALAAIVFLARRGAAVEPGRSAPLAAAHALLALLPYTNLRSSGSPGEAIQRLAPLADRVPAFDLGRGPLDEMARSVEALGHAAVPA